MTEYVYFTAPRWYSGPEVDEPIVIWDMELKIRKGLDRTKETSPHPLWDSDEDTAAVIGSAFKLMAQGWPRDYVEANGHLILPPKDVFDEAINRVGEDGHQNIASGTEFYMQNFYPREPEDMELRKRDPYYVAKYILKEHQV